MSETDTDLLDRFARHRDRPAFDQLTRRYIDFVYATAFRERPAEAEDITQAVFLLLARKAAAVPRHRIGGWLFRTTQYCCAAARRSAARRSRHERNAAAERPEVAAMADSHSTETNSLLPLLNDVLASLGRADREAIVHRYLRGMDMPAIAGVLCTSEPAARKRITRAVEKMRQAFARRGVTSATSAAVAGVLTLASTKAAPAATVAVVCAAILSPTAATSAVGGLSIGAAKMMFMSKLKFAAVFLVIAAFFAGIGIVIEHTLAVTPPPIAATTMPATAIEALTKRLQDADTLQVDSRATKTEAGRQLVVTASLQIASANRGRTSLMMDYGTGQAMSVVYVMNGKQVATWMNGQQQPSEQQDQAATPEPMKKTVALMARLGVAGALLNARAVPAGQKPAPLDPDKDLPITNLKETTMPIDGVPKPAITYSVGGVFFPEKPAQVTLWLDPATGLPIRREIGAGESKMTETYFNWRLGQAIKPEVFDTQIAPTTQP